MSDYKRYSLSLNSPAENFQTIAVCNNNGQPLIVLDRESAEFLVSQLVTLIDAIKALEAIDDSDANGESAGNA